ncbi:hypothetical protein [Streptomyces sp. NPDC015414]|uniref:hypothetical protein n=1 Tax=Streptomyces sp. NPDC015414 TaxID=3364957 RepID=UPI0036FADAC1
MVIGRDEVNSGTRRLTPLFPRSSAPRDASRPGSYGPRPCFRQPHRTRLAGLATRAPNIVDSGLSTRTTAAPDWLTRLDQLEHLTKASAADRHATLGILVVDLLVLPYLRHGTLHRVIEDTSTRPRGSSSTLFSARNPANRLGPAVSRKNFLLNEGVYAYRR